MCSVHICLARGQCLPSGGQTWKLHSWSTKSHGNSLRPPVRARGIKSEVWLEWRKSFFLMLGKAWSFMFVQTNKNTKMLFGFDQSAATPSFMLIPSLGKKFLQIYLPTFICMFVLLGKMDSQHTVVEFSSLQSSSLTEVNFLPQFLQTYVILKFSS